MFNVRYQVLLTPLIEKNTYGDVIDITQDVDISDFIKDKGIGKIKNDINNGDYEFGIFSYSDVTITFFNEDGRFNDESGGSKYFKYRRDLAKVQINFIDENSNVTSSFLGLFNEESARQDFNKGLLKAKVLSLASIFNKVRVPAGLISNETLFSDAILNILNLSDIKAVLNISADNVNVALDLEIDSGIEFDNKSAKKALNDLLLVSNSILYIDRSNNVIVKDRSSTSTIFKRFYAGNERLGRENILSLKKYNNGYQRLFNSITINGYNLENNISVNRYGLRSKDISLSFVTSQITYNQISNVILKEFSSPRYELEITVLSKDAKDVNILDEVIVDYDNTVQPANGEKFFPIYGQAIYGENNSYPHVFNIPAIRNIDLLKIIGIYEDPKKMQTTLKLRYTGNALTENNENLPIYGEAVYGESSYQ